MNKEKIDQLVSLNAELVEDVELAIALFNQLLRNSDESLLVAHKWRNGDIVHVDCDYVTIQWEETWQYGGHDQGTYDIPIEALSDNWESAIKELVDEIVEKYQTPKTPITDVKSHNAKIDDEIKRLQSMKL